MLPAKLLICLPTQRANSTLATSTIIQGIKTIRGLGHSLLPAFARPNEASQLFIDHVTIALAAYVLQTYGVGEISSLNPSGGLLPRQERLVKEMLAANLDGNVSVSPIGAPGHGIFPGLGFSTSDTPLRLIR
jgi:hypothetical protein